MIKLKRNYPAEQFNLIFLSIFIVLYFSQCSVTPDPLRGKKVDIIANQKKLETISHIEAKGNVVIHSTQNDGKLNAGFRYVMPDTLLIQFRDIIGRKQALMGFRDDDFELWLQRKNKRYGRGEIPGQYSLFVFEELTLSEIRKLFIGSPLFTEDDIQTQNNKVFAISRSDNQTKLVSYIAPNGLLRRVEIYDLMNQLSSVFNYADYQRYDEIYFPGEIEILDLTSSVDLKIKMYHYSLKYYKLSSVK